MNEGSNEKLRAGITKHQFHSFFIHSFMACYYSLSLSDLFFAFQYQSVLLWSLVSK